MHPGLHFDVDAECDAETWPSDVVTGCGGDLKVLGFDCSSHHIHWAPELPGQNVCCRDALLEVIFKVLGHHHPSRIDNIDARIWNAVGRRARLDRFVEDVVCANDFRVRIREQWIRDVLAVRETLKGADGVIADRRYTEALLPDRT